MNSKRFSMLQTQIELIFSSVYYWNSLGKNAKVNIFIQNIYYWGAWASLISVKYSIFGVFGPLSRGILMRDVTLLWPTNRIPLKTSGSNYREKIHYVYIFCHLGLRWQLENHQQTDEKWAFFTRRNKWQIMSPQMVKWALEPKLGGWLEVFSSGVKLIIFPIIQNYVGVL